MKEFTIPQESRSKTIHLDPYKVDENGVTLIIQDLHFPFYEENALNLAVKTGKKMKAKRCIINGDACDFPSISRHVQYRAVPSLRDDIMGFTPLLQKLRDQFEFLDFKEGNHEERIDAYARTHAPYLADLKGVNLRSFLEADKLGISWIADKRKIKLGKLNLWHGHEFGGGGGQVNVASWLLRKCGGGTADACGHFHRSDSCSSRNANEFTSAAWAFGCLCHLKPFWLPQNQWNLGFAVVETSKGGDFNVHNFRIINGQIYG